MPGADRRAFMKKAFWGTLSAAWGGASRSLIPPVPARPGRFARNGMFYRRLGRTGLEISEVSLGGSPLPDWAVLMQAVERGINYIDTSDSYQNGNSERAVGRLFKQFGRDKLFVHTRFHLRGSWSEQSIIQSVEGSLRRLATDYVDVLGIHGVSDPAQLTDERVLSAFEKLKKEGKYRFRGLSCHTNQQDVIPAAVECGLYDMVTMAYNVFDIQETEAEIETYDDYLGASGIRRLISLAHSQDIGVVAMKTLKVGGRRQNLAKYTTGDTTVFQAMLKWVLANPQISAAIVEMLTFSQLEEDLAVSGRSLSPSEQQTLYRFVAEKGRNYCHMCGTCKIQCPAGLPIPDILRLLAYHEGYRKTQRAQKAYAGLKSNEKPPACRDCGQCEKACPYRVSVRTQIKRAHALLG